MSDLLQEQNARCERERGRFRIPDVRVIEEWTVMMKLLFGTLVSLMLHGGKFF